jgi:CHAT domain-containing protein
VRSHAEGLDGAWLAHVGAHGRFRGDNPMFSALEMADGPLTVYDLEGLRRPPYRLLLTACESGVGSPTGADELLGLASSLTALGTAGLLASVVPVNDEATVPFSLAVHERLRAGDDLASSLLAARRAAADPVARATAWSFLALGGA